MIQLEKKIKRKINCEIFAWLENKLAETYQHMEFYSNGSTNYLILSEKAKVLIQLRQFIQAKE